MASWYAIVVNKREGLECLSTVKKNAAPRCPVSRHMSEWWPTCQHQLVPSSSTSTRVGWRIQSPNLWCQRYTVPEYLGSSSDRNGLENQMQLLGQRHHRGHWFLVLRWPTFYQPRRSYLPDRPYWFVMFVILVIDCAMKLLSLTVKSLASGNMDMVVVRQIDIDDDNRN